MNDINGYFSQQDKIANLEAEIVALKAGLSSSAIEFNAEIKKSNLEKRSIKVKFDKLKLEMTTGNISRTTRARILVRSFINGDKSLMLKDIADKCHLSIQTVNGISYKLRHTK